MPYEYTPPKYARVIGEIQRRIESGEYPPGSLLPSEHQLSAEFGIARPTVVRALRVLRQEGWIDTQQGKGSFVRGRPALAQVASERRGLAELDRDESREAGELVKAGKAAAPARIAALLAVAGGIRIDHVIEQVTARRAAPDEARLLGISRSDPMLALYVSARDASGQPMLAVAVAMP